MVAGPALQGFDGLRFRHWQLESREDGVLVIAFDRADAPVNTFNQEYILEEDSNLNEQEF